MMWQRHAKEKTKPRAWARKSVSDRLAVSLSERGSAQGLANSTLWDTPSSMGRKGSLPPNYCICLCTCMSIGMGTYLLGSTDAYTCPNTLSLAGKLCTKWSVSEVRAEGQRIDNGGRKTNQLFLLPHPIVNWLHSSLSMWCHSRLCKMVSLLYYSPITEEKKEQSVLQRKHQNIILLVKSAVNSKLHNK